MTTSATTVAKSLIASLLLAGLVAFTIGQILQESRAADVTGTSATVAKAERSGTLLALTPLF